jgi:putative DNA primase/helicase
MIEVMQLARNRWHEILGRLGMDDSYLTGKHTACPLCGGKDRFRFTNHNGDGKYFCNQCGNGSGWDLAAEITGQSKSSIAAEIKEMVGDIKPSKPVVEDLSKNKARLERIRSGLDYQSQINAKTLYLRNRGLVNCKRIGFHPGLDYYEDGKSIGNYPAMVCIFADAEGIPATLHITYLTPDGQKAPVRSVKKIMPPCRKTPGGAIRLTSIYPEMGIAEGVETALAVMSQFQIPCWAAATAGMLEKFEPPKEVTKLHIFADADKSFTGQAVAYTLANRLGRNIACEVHVPEKLGMDWADLTGRKA